MDSFAWIKKCCAIIVMGAGLLAAGPVWADEPLPEIATDRFLIPQAELSDNLLDELEDLESESGDDLDIQVYEDAEVVAVTLVDEAKELVLEEIDEDVIETVQFFRPLLESSTAAFGADVPLANGYDGSGYAIVVIDTGVDASHPFLNVASEACFSNSLVIVGVTTVSTCPGGDTVETGAGAAATCQTGNLSGCTHGNHAAGVAAGATTDVAGRYGVASGAEIIAINVFTRVEDEDICSGSSPCLLATSEDLIAGLDHVLSLHNDSGFTTPIAAVNMSLGGGAYSSQSVCDTDNASTKTAIDALVAVGIPTIAAAGNDASGTQIAAPACISSVVGVGSVGDDDAVSSFTNLNELVDFVAPGESVTSAGAGTSYQTLSGTSFATPHIAGAWAVLRQLLPGLSSSEIQTELTTDAVAVTDGRVGGSGLTYQRPDLSATFTRLFTPPTITFSVPTTTGVGTIADTTIQITDVDGVLAGNVAVDSGSTASAYDLTCSQTDTNTVDCTIVVASSGDLGIAAQDDNGFAITTTQSGYTITNTAPEVTISAGSTTGQDSITDTTITVTDNAGVLAADVTVDGATTASVTNFACSQTTARLVECAIAITGSGDLVISATDTDLVGQATQEGYVVTKTGPSITVLAPTKASMMTIADATISVSDPDGVAAADVLIDSASTASATLVNCVENIDQTQVDCELLIDGSGDVIIAATDQSTNQTTATETGFLIDTTGPVITFTSPTTSSSSAISDVTITVTDDAGITASNVTIDASTSANTTNFVCTQTDANTVDCTVVITDSGQLVIAANDDLGNAASTTVGSFTIQAASSGGGGGGRSPRPKACKDPEALNYNDSRRTRKDNSLCQYQAADPDQVTFFQPLASDATTEEKIEQIIKILRLLQLLRQLLAQG